MRYVNHRRFLKTTALVALMALPTKAYAGPENGVTTSGGATITTSGSATNIHQSTDRAIIRWDSFDVGASESVQFHQPSSSSITVNRIRDNKPSQIDGRISANGNIVLINPNGVVFGAAATVDVGGLVATTSDLEDDNAFMGGGAVKFTKPGQHDAAIINRGSITVKEGGLVGLVAPNVENHGIIEARLGKVALASGDIATIDFAGDGLIKLEVTDAVLSQTVLNTGTIKADGGSILLTAAQARGMVDALVSNTGTLQANTVKVAGVEKKGSVTLTTKGLDITLPRGNGIVFNEGHIEAEGKAADESGGQITILSDKIQIGDGSYVTASGDTDGGSIKIGGDYQGGPGLPTSDMVFISENVILNAEGRRRNGGTIILWSDAHTWFHGHADASGGVDGGLIEVSSKGALDYTGTVDLSAVQGARGTLLLDPTDIVISTGANANVTGTAPFTPNIDNGPSVLNITTLQNALASGNVIVQTRSTGAQAGNITVSNAITWASGNTLTLDAHNNIIVNAAISGQNLRFVVGNDLQLNAAVGGAGTLTIEQAGDASTVGIGASAVGTLNLSTVDLGNITNGWGDIVIGKLTGTGAMDLRAVTWNDNLTIRSGTGVITTNGSQTMGANNLTIQTDGDLNLAVTNSLIGTGNLSILQTSAATTIGLGGTGTINLTSTEIGRMNSTWNAITIGRTDGSGQMNVAALTWNDALVLQSGNGLINVSGVQTMGANNLTITTDGDVTLGVTNTLYGSGVLTIQQSTASTTIGLNDTGTINFTTTEVARFRDGWSSIVIGRADGTGAINVGALSWVDPLTLQTGTGVITVNGAQSVAANTLTLRSDVNFAINANLVGTGALTLQQTSANVSMGIGTGQTGAINISDAQRVFFVDGWASQTFGRADSTADLNIAGSSWTDALILQTGAGLLSINGNLAMAANSLTLRTDSDIAVGGTLASTGTLTFIQSSASTSMGIGTGETGTYAIDSLELGNIVNGWASLVFGRVDGTGDVNVAAATWLDPLTLRSGTGAMNINGNQTMGANNLAITTSSNLGINAALTGTGTLTIAPTIVSTSIGLGNGQSGTILLDDTELSRITNGWTDIVIGSTTGTGALNVGARSWNDRLTLRTLSGVISINGTQTMAANNLTITTNGDLAVYAALTGTGTLTINPNTATTTMGIGTGQAGMIQLSDAELDLITNGWAAISFGNTSMTGAMNIGARTWNDSVAYSIATGIMTVNGTQTMGANNLSFRLNSNIAINADLIGTGTITFYGAGNGTTIGVGNGQAGTIQLTDAKLARIIDGWAIIVIGNTSMTGVMNIGARTWYDSVDFRTNSGAININGAQNVGSSNLTLRTNTNLTIGYALTGTGTINIMPSGNTTMGIGTGQTGTLQLSDAELAFITDGWSSIVLGNTSTTAAMNVGSYTWNDSVDFRTLSGVISINGAQNVGANNLIIRSNANPVIGAALIGTGTISLIPVSTNTGIGLGTGQTGAFNFTDSELAFITNGWANIVVGSSAITGALNLGALTWNDNLALQTNSGIITINGAQTMGANDLTFITAANPVLNANLIGSGRLTFTPNTTGTTMGIGDSQSGTVNFTNAELARIVNGWSQITFGRADSTGAINIGANTWNDNVAFQVGSGLMTVVGAQNVGANNLTLSAASDLVLNGNLTGTGMLTIRTSALNTTMGIGNAQTGTLQLSNAELARIQNGWSDVVMGSTSGLGTINVGAYTWLDKMTFVTQGDVVVNGAQNTTETTGTTLVYATTNGRFINNAGASAINPGTGRYLVYSVEANVDTLGGIIPPTVVVNKSYVGYGPASVVESGSVHIYSGATSKTIYLSIEDADKIYGDNLPVFSYTYIAGLQGSDTLTDVIASYTMNAVGASVYDNAGTTRTITGTFNANLGYTVIATNGTLTVTKAMITVESDAASRVYGDTNPILTATYTGFKNGDDETDIDTLANLTTSATLTSNVGTYAIIAADADDSNYDFVYLSDNLTVTKATLTATVQASTRAYGDANPTYAINYTGFKNSETFAVIDTLAHGNTVATATSNVGSYAVTGSGGIDNNYNFNYVAGTMTVTKANLVATADNKNRTYGDANPALSVTYSGFKNSETLTVIDTLASASTAVTTASNAGTYAINVSGASDNNYNISYVGGTFTVDKAVLTATAGNGTRVYGDANPAIGVTYAGFKNSETSAVIDTLATGSSVANFTSNVGSYATTASGALDNNYSFTYVDGTLSVTKATLTATAGSVSREYGDANPAIGVTYAGYKNGETSAVIDTLATASSAANFTSIVGSYATTASGGVDNNYNFTYVDGTLSVTKANLTATAGNGTREYGDANPAIGVTYAGFKNGETLAVIDTLATGSTAATATTNVGSYATTASGASDNNYNFTYVGGSLTISKASLTATAGNGTREYGDANPAIGVTYAGFKNGETSAVIDTLATASTTANATSNVASYATTASGGVDNNYSFSYVDGTLSVTKAMLTATAGNGNRDYGDVNPAIGVSYTGFKNGETSAVIDTLASASSAANGTSNVGSYATTASGGIDNNYNFTYVGGILAVNKATVTAMAGNVSREYGDANPAIGVTYSGFKNGETSAVIDTLSSASTAANATSNVGSYATTATGGVDNNYNFTYVGGTLTVNKATVTATAGNGTREYGDANPAIGVTYTGFKNGETSAVVDTLATGSSAANSTSNVGSYATTASGASDNNYTFSYVGGTLSITKANLTATAGDATREYGDANPEIGVIYTGFKNGETSAVIDTQANPYSVANAMSNVGSYATIATGGMDNNYSFTYVDGTLSVTTATLIATASSGTREYGDANPSIGVTYTGFKNGETSAVIDTQATGLTSANNASNVGSYVTTASGASDNNYSFTYVDGTLAVTKATLTATAGNGTREYGDSNPSIGVTYAGFKNGETQAVIDTLVTGSASATATSNVGSYTTTASGGVDNNYNFTYVGGTLLVTKATLTATAGNATREYGVANPAIGVTYTGFKNGETQGVIDTVASGSSTANTTSNVGSYITTASGASDNNYNFIYSDGALSVTKANLLVTAQNAERKIGEAAPLLSVSYSGFRNGETISVLDAAPNASTIVNAGTPEGTYAIIASGGLDNNYSFSYIDGAFTVRAADYIPPPPSVVSSPLPPTVQSVISNNPGTDFGNPTSMIVLPSSYNYMNAAGSVTIGHGAGTSIVSIVSADDDFVNIWQQSPFLIALTDDIQAFYMPWDISPVAGNSDERAWY